METITLSEVFAWVLSGGGAGILAYIAVAKVKWLKDLPPDYKRYWSLGLAAIIAAGVWLASIGMGYVAQPETWRSWVETVFGVVALALLMSQTVHGAVDLRYRRLNGEQRP